MSLIPVPEVREMVAVAKEYAAGKIHFSYMVGPTEHCVWWARVHGVHPAILALAKEWQLMADQVWNEWGQHADRLPEAEYRRRVTADLSGPAH